MKSLSCIINLGFLALGVNADFETMNNDLHKAQAAVAEQQAADGTDGPGDKTITQADMGLINEYGCWCYFQSDHSKGRSGPVDEIDTLCKRLHDGYTCAIMDAAEAGFDCIPWEVSYNSAVGSGLSMGMTLDTLRTECDSQNTNTVSCENWACKIEGYFVQQLLLFFTYGGPINHDNRHANGFDAATMCPVTTGVDSERQCCDEQPLRFPYKTYDGARDCCVSHTFDTNMYSCCDDGVVRITCV